MDIHSVACVFLWCGGCSCCVMDIHAVSGMFMLSCEQLYSLSWTSYCAMNICVVSWTLCCHEHLCTVMDIDAIMDIDALSWTFILWYVCSCSVEDVHVVSWISMLCQGCSCCAMNVHAVLWTIVQFLSWTSYCMLCHEHLCTVVSWTLCCVKDIYTCAISCPIFSHPWAMFWKIEELFVSNQSWAGRESQT